MLRLGFTNSESVKFSVVCVFSIHWFAVRCIRLVVGVLTETQILRHPCTKYINLLFLSIFPLLGSEAQCPEGAWLGATVSDGGAHRKCGRGEGACHYAFPGRFPVNLKTDIISHRLVVDGLLLLLPDTVMPCALKVAVPSSAKQVCSDSLLCFRWNRGLKSRGVWDLRFLILWS